MHCDIFQKQIYFKKRHCAFCGALDNLEYHVLIPHPTHPILVKSNIRVLCELCHYTTHYLLDRNLIEFKKYTFEHLNSIYVTTKTKVINRLKQYHLYKNNFKNQSPQSSLYEHIDGQLLP